MSSPIETLIERWDREEAAAPRVQATPVTGRAAAGVRRWRGDLASIALGLGIGACAAVAILTGLPKVALPGGWFTFGGSVTAMVGTFLALVSVLLAARLPFLERELGQDRLLALHRAIGPAALLLIAAHVLLTTLGWSVAESRGPVAEFAALVLGYEWMMPALVAFIIMVALGISSMPAIRRRMKYETWHVAHMYFYIAVLLAYGHQVAFGSMFTQFHWLATTWLVLYALTFGAVVNFRVLLPLWVSIRHRLRVSHIVDEGPGVVSVYITGRRLDRLSARGGQFYGWRFLTRHRWWQAHPYSLSAAPDGHSLRITVKALGDHSAGLSDLRPGTRVIAEGPYGVFTADRRHSDSVVCVAAGVGITPIRAILDELPDHSDVTIIYRVRTAEELALKQELDAVRLRTGWKVRYLTGDNDAHPIDPDFFIDHAPWVMRSDVFLCGPGKFAELVLTALSDLGIPEHRIHHEQFAF